MKEYALYKGDELIAIGTIKELAKMQGVKEETIRYYTSKVYRKRTTEEGYRVIKLEEEDDGNGKINV